MGIRQQVTHGLARLLLSDQIDAMGQTLNLMESAYRRGPYSLSEEDLVRQLVEADSWLVDYVMKQRNWQLMSSAVHEFSETDRLRAVDESRLMYHYDVQVHRAINAWTDFGFGRKVEVAPKDDALAEVWEEFWSAKRNQPILSQRRIHNMSNILLRDGELFLVFFGSRVEGKTTIRRIATQDISEIVYQADDPDIPLYYVRNRLGQESIYYPDWCASETQLKAFEIPRNAIRADEMSTQVAVDGKPQNVTSVVMMHVCYDDLNGRGWPMLGRVFEWSRVLRSFLGDRAAVAKRVAMFVDEISHGAGSRATDAIEAKFNSTLGSSSWGTDTNPPGVAGSTLVHNKAIDVTRRPLTTGGGDAMSDGQMFAGQVSAGTGMPLHWMGWPQALSNRATAREMARPWLEQLNRYGMMWEDVFSGMVEVIAKNSTSASKKEFEDLTAEVNMQAPLDVDTNDIAQAMNANSSAVGAGSVDSELAIEANNRYVDLGLTVMGIPIEEEQQPEGPEPGAVEALIQAARENVENGTVSAEHALEFVLGELEHGN